jgi:hypothetical protein
MSHASCDGDVDDQYDKQPKGQFLQPGAGHVAFFPAKLAKNLGILLAGR